MTKKPRKPLNDALAEQFVYGQDRSQSQEINRDSSPENSSPSEELVEPVSATQPLQDSSLVKKLQVQPKEGTKRFTVDLPESMHRKLSILAAQTGRSKADIVRMLLNEALKDS